MTLRATKVFGVVGLCSAALAIGACTDIEQPETEPSADAAPTRVQTPSEVGDSTPTAKAPPSETPTPDDPIPVDTEDAVDTLGSGDVLADVGEEVGLKENGSSVFRLTVTDIDLQSACPSRLSGEVTANGSFVVVNLQANLDPNFVDDQAGGNNFVALGSDTFAIVDAAGNPDSTAHSVRAFECYSQEDLVAPVIYPGESESGKIVLETQLDSGFVVFNPWGVPGSGWAWEFPAK